MLAATVQAVLQPPFVQLKLEKRLLEILTHILVFTVLCQNRLKYQKQPIRQEVLWDVSIWLSEPQVTAMMTLILWKSA